MNNGHNVFLLWQEADILGVYETQDKAEGAKKEREKYLYHVGDRFGAESLKIEIWGIQ